MKINKWEKAQEKETGSWLSTDMSYDYLMNNWRDRRGDFKMIIDKINSDSSIIDIGSGPVSVFHIFPRCREMIALDSLNDKYKEKYTQLDYIKYISSKAERLDYPNNHFNAVLCINALDHMDDYLSALEEMMRCLKSSGLLYLEYENSSPITILLSKLGYKKPLNDFHPILVENKNVIRKLKENGFEILKVDVRPQFSFKKVVAIIKILLGKKQASSYEKNISATNYGIIRTFFHYFVMFLERIMFFYYPKRFGYFTLIIAKKINTK